jgi:DinB superfamily
MPDVGVIGDLFGDFIATMHREITDLDAEALAWQPDPEANSISITVWHVARWMDVLGTRILQGRSAEGEQWHTQGWAKRTGYDPRGIGAYGIGAITGYTQEEVAAIPRMDSADLLAYLDQAYAVVKEQLTNITAEALEGPVPDPVFKGTIYRWLRILVGGFFGHVGEIQALKSMRERTAAAITTATTR